MSLINSQWDDKVKRLRGCFFLKKRVHVFGASGSGTTTIAKMLCDRLGYRHFDTDDFFWETTLRPFTVIRPIEQRKELLQSELESNDKWILSGSLCGWGDIFIPYFELVIFVYLPKEIRMERLKEREYKRYGDSILPNGELHEKSQEFINWASKYDDSSEIGRNSQRHQQWFLDIPCPKLKIENSGALIESVNDISNQLLQG